MSRVDPREVCRNCRWWDNTTRESKENRGACSVRAPSRSVDGVTYWAYTDADNWCGEFQHLPGKPGD